MGVAQAPGRLGSDPGFDATPVATRSERIYAVLLRAYPASFRTRYRQEMVLLFADQLRDARASNGGAGAATTWFRTVIDLASSAAGEHLRRDRDVAMSLATFAPSRAMRLLGFLAVAGGVVLLWAFVSWNPFANWVANTARLVLFWVGGMGVAIAFHGRQAAASPRLARVATTVVVLAGAANVVWLLLALDRDNPFGGTFGLVGFWASFVGWLAASAYGAFSIARRAWRGMPRWSSSAVRLGAVALLVGGVVGTFGMDRIGLTRSEPFGDLFGSLGATGVGAVGLGWLLLGAVLLFAGRGERTSA
ncbi:MAG TPA: hypothetical protein VM451_06460 [Candidatus Limnocylindria bacterium]|nr:hypothetical protein [Candidatus Limnocylindria bacterium]